MNGAESLVHTLLAGGVEVAFTNPGTSEMHFVAALDRLAGMRCVLALFEGVATGAADGYARISGRPAATLLHLGPGLANGLANLHNARRAASPVVNVVGDHATYHRKYDAPLTSDIEALARPVSSWVRTARSAVEVAADGAAAIAAALAPPGRIATLILPADTAWEKADGAAARRNPPGRATVPSAAVGEAATALRAGAPAILLVGGPGLRGRGLRAAGRIAAATGARLMAATSNARIERGAGRVAVTRIPYVVDQALAMLAGTRHAVLAGAKAPVAFFAYPGKPSRLLPEDCAVHTLARADEDVAGALEALAEALDAAEGGVPVQARVAVSPPSGALDSDALARAIAAAIPENAIVADESITAGRSFYAATAGAPPHDWLQVTGGSIGCALPVATGAAVAAPERKVLCLHGDGGAMYTLQALWTQAREGLDVTTVIFANRAYRILEHEFAGVGAGAPGKRARDMLALDRPALDWVALARGMGVEGVRVDTADAFSTALGRGLATPGPYLVEAVI